MIKQDETRLVSDVFKDIPAVDEALVQKMLDEELLTFNQKIIVLDDDPTGVQTVNGISVYTDWSKDSIKQGFLSAEVIRLFAVTIR